MQSQFRIILDDYYVFQDDLEPQFWNKLETDIIRDRERKGILQSYKSEIIFRGDSYKYIYDKFHNSGYCNDTKIELQEYRNNAWKTFYPGLIRPNIVFNEKELSAKATIEDDSFFSRINNNKNIADFPFGGKSKNGVDIDPADFYRVSFFDPADGILAFAPDLTYKNVCYRAFELFRWLVEYMSDNEVGFVSDLFDIGGELEGVCLTHGYVLRFIKAVGGLPEADFKSSHPKISFDSLYNELHKKFNLGFVIERINNRPHLRIERAKDLFKNENKKVKFSDIDSIEKYIEVEELYSVLNIGGHYLNESEVDADPLTFPSSQSWTGFARETWTIAGQCNDDRPFDLQGQFIVDSNTMEDVMGFSTSGGTNTNYDSDWFIIETTVLNPLLGEAVVGEPFADGIYCYNPGLRNSEVANNFYGFVPNAIVQYLSQQTPGLFYADTQGSQTVTGNNNYFQIIAPNEIIDPGMIYDPLTGEATIVNPGQYTFQCGVTFAGLWGTWLIGAKIEKCDAGGMALTDDVNEVTFSNALFGSSNLSFTINCNAGEKIKFYGLATQVSGIVGTNTTSWVYGYVQSSNAPDTGGTYYGADPADYKVLLHKFNYNLSVDAWTEIENNPADKYEFYMFGQQPRWGHIKSIRYNRQTGNCLVVLMASQNANKSININDFSRPI